MNAAQGPKMSINSFVSASAQIEISVCDITPSTNSQKASQAKVSCVMNFLVRTDGGTFIESLFHNNTL